MSHRMSLSGSARRDGPCVRRSCSGSAAVLRSAAEREGTGGGGLTIGGARDPAEKAADEAADRVMAMARPAPLVRRACADCAEEGEGRQVRAKSAPGGSPAAPGAASAPATAGQSKAIGALGGGRPLASAERAFFEPRFGADLSPVRVHDGPAADRASSAIDARAFSIGNDIAFARGEYSPGSDGGRRLMAHELAHVLQQGPARRSIRRKPRAPAVKDPLCDSYSATLSKAMLFVAVQNLLGGADSEARLKLIQRLKIFHRCADETDIAEIKAYLTQKLGAKEAAKLWKSAGTAFGGYRGVYPGYYSGKGWLSGLGTSEVEPSARFDYNPRKSDPKTYAPLAEAAGSAMAGTAELSDILYFYGHQYAQYGHPGVFANGDQTNFIDLRKLEGKGDFSRVKLIISTSCATICLEALQLFAKLFPNAVILGYRKSAPKAGEAVRKSFDKAIKGLKKPLLLNQPVDVAAIIEAWKSVVKKHHPKEHERMPGYYKDGTVHFLKDGKWESMPGTDPANACKVKGTEIQQAQH